MTISMKASRRGFLGGLLASVAAGPALAREAAALVLSKVPPRFDVFRTGMYVGGMRPAFVMLKRRDGGGRWHLEPLDAAEASEAGPRIDILSDGFKIKTSDARMNDRGAAYQFYVFDTLPTVKGPINADESP